MGLIAPTVRRPVPLDVFWLWRVGIGWITEDAQQSKSPTDSAGRFGRQPDQRMRIVSLINPAPRRETRQEEPP